MIFSVIVSVLLVSLAFYIAIIISNIIAQMDLIFADNLIKDEKLLTNASDEELKNFCPDCMQAFL